MATRRRPTSKRRPTRALLVAAIVAAMLANAPAASAAQSSTWGWTTDTYTMSFFGGIPYVGCEKAKLRVPNAGSTGTIRVTTWTSIVVGWGTTCSTSSMPGALNANTIRTRARVLRNGAFVAGCDTGLVLNSGGEGVLSVTDTCSKTSPDDATWKLYGTYGWWDYDDSTWRGESIGNPQIVD